MSDHHAGYIVTLDKNIRDDDSRKVISALRQIRGVRSVEPVVADVTLAIATSRMRGELIEKVLEVLNP